MKDNVSKVKQILFIQKKLLFVYMFLIKNKLPKRTNIHDLHREYIAYVSDKASTKFIYGKYPFANVIQDFGVRRLRTKGPTAWKQPDKYDPQDLVDLINYHSEVIKDG